MNKLLSLVLVSLFSVYLLNACTTMSEKSPPETFAPKKQEEKKILPGSPMQQALVIGNAEYQSKPLTNPVNDANDMANALNEQGFTVFLHTNLDFKQMEEVISEFKDHLFARQKSVGLFYFSGHGAQVEDKSYLIPVNNSKIEFDDEVPWKAVEVESKILEQMQSNNKGLNIIILDACRNNPYPPRRVKGDDEDGLAPIVSPEGFIIGYATAPGRTVPDSKERNSLYTKHLLKAIRPNKRIDDVLMQVHNAVKKESNEKQIPWYSASITKPFCFGGCP